MRCVAIITVRNGASYVENCLDHLFSNGIEAAVIDHDSSDGTYELCESFLGNGLCYLGRMPYNGAFSLSDQLLEKSIVAGKLNADWLIHQDIDEQLQAPEDGLSLHDSIVREDLAGYNCINFNEFVFLPLATSGASFYTGRDYYFFEPSANRLMRAWKTSAKLSNLEAAGHRLKGDLVLSPVTHILRHYMFTSQQHAYEKYNKTVFSSPEVEKGWHRARIGVPLNKMTFPGKDKLKELVAPSSRLFDTSEPYLKHYWKWE